MRNSTVILFVKESIETFYQTLNNTVHHQYKNAQ